MSKTSRQIDDLLSRIDGTPWGPEERRMIDEAIAIAVESGDEKREYEAKIRLTASAHMLGDTDAMLSSFAWCVSKYDQNPKKFPNEVVDGRAGLLWQNKWMASTLSASPIFPAEQIRAVLDDMEQRYQKAGVGLSGVLTARFESAWSNGWLDEAAAAHRQLALTERDDYSHCDACGRSLNSQYAAEFGDEDTAITLVEEMLDGSFSCGEEPERALSYALVPYLRRGELDKAKSAHLRSYRDARDNASNLGIIANHFLFCAITGNEARGLAMLERHLGWLAHDELNQSGLFGALCAIGLLLDQVERAGHGGAIVRGAERAELVSILGRHDGHWTVSELAATSWAAARRIGDAFDARNSNGYHRSQLEATKALAAEHYELPIHSDGFAAQTATATETEPADAAGWLMLARERGGSGDVTEAGVAASRGLETAEGVIRARLFSTLVATLVSRGDLEEAGRVLPARIEALEQIGDTAQAGLERRVGLLMFGTADEGDIPVLAAEFERSTAAGEPPATRADLALTLGIAHADAEQIDDAVAFAHTAVEIARTDDSDYLLQSARHFLANILMHQGDVDAARAVVGELIESSNRAMRADGHRAMARLLGGAGEFEAALASADRALDLDLALASRKRSLEDAMLAASLLDDLGRMGEAVTKLHLAVNQAQLIEGNRMSWVRFALGRQMVKAGLGTEAVEVLTQVYDEETSDEATASSRAETLYWLGHAFRQSEEYGSAVGAWNGAIALHEEGESWVGAARTGLPLGQLYLDAGMTGDAVEALEHAEGNVRKDDEALGVLVDVLHLLGRARCEHGDESGLVALDEVIRIARQNEAAWMVADASDSRARGLAALERYDEAVPSALAAADLYLAAGDEIAAGNAVFFAARTLAALQRHEEAVALFHAAAEQLKPARQLSAAANFELADSLDAIGRPADAAAARALAEAASS